MGVHFHIILSVLNGPSSTFTTVIPGRKEGYHRTR